MAERIEFKTEFNAKDIVAFLKKTAITLNNDLSPLMKVARVFLKNTVDENFETEGTHTGDKWKEWSPAYKIQRIKKGRMGGRILSLDGHLRKSIQAKSGKDFALVGTNKIYAAIHNFGGNSTLKHNQNMPQREFMRINQTQLEFLQADLYVALKELIEQQDTNRKVFGG